MKINPANVGFTGLNGLPSGYSEISQQPDLTQQTQFPALEGPPALSLSNPDLGLPTVNLNKPTRQPEGVGEKILTTA